MLVVIGDGSMTGGMSFEALNHIGHLGTRLVIVLNDNEMSISENVGALASYLARVRLDQRYQRLRDGVESRLSALPGGKVMVDAGEAVKESFKQLVVPGMLFEELGLKYVGPIDGHDIAVVEQAVAAAKKTDGPVIVHAVTHKGQGYSHAEEQPDAFHGIGPFSVETGKANGGGGHPSYTEVFSRSLVAEARGRRPDRRDHGGHALGYRARSLRARLPGALLRRGHRRRARGRDLPQGWRSADACRSSPSTRRSCSARTTS